MYCIDEFRKWCEEGGKKATTEKQDTKPAEEYDNALTLLTSYFHFLKSNIGITESDRLIIVVLSAFYA